MPVVRRSLLAGLALVVSASVALVPLAHAQDDAAGVEQMLIRINQMRSAAGIATLARDARLDASARAHSADMAANDMLEHVSPRSGDPMARIAAAGLPNVQVAENIALNADVLAAHGALVGSDAHRANLLNPALTHIGLAAVRSPRGVYVTQVFAALGAAPVAQLPTPAVAAPVASAALPEPAPPSVAAPSIAAATAAPAELPLAQAPAAPLAPAPGVQVAPGARRVAGYWVFSQSRWWYYPLPVDAQPGQALRAAQLPPGAAPPGYGPQATSAPLPVYGPPPSYAQPPGAYFPPAPVYYPPPGPAYYGPGRYGASPSPFGGWSPRRHGRWRR